MLIPDAGSAIQPEQFALLTSGELRATGLSRRQIDDLVRAGSLVRVRKGRYVRADAPPALIRAARLGGRLDCISLLSAMGVFVLRNDRLTPSDRCRRQPAPSESGRREAPLAKHLRGPHEPVR